MIEMDDPDFIICGTVCCHIKHFLVTYFICNIFTISSWIPIINTMTSLIPCYGIGNIIISILVMMMNGISLYEYRFKMISEHISKPFTKFHLLWNNKCIWSLTCSPSHNMLYKLKSLTHYDIETKLLYPIFRLAVNISLPFMCIYEFLFPNRFPGLKLILMSPLLILILLVCIVYI